MKTITLTDLRNRIFEVINDVFYKGESYKILKREKEVALLTPMDDSNEVNRQD